MLKFWITAISAGIIGFMLGHDVAFNEKLSQCDPAPGKDQLIGSIRRADGGITCVYASGYGQATYSVGPKK